jgi:hypothetical protein
MYYVTDMRIIWNCMEAKKEKGKRARKRYSDIEFIL